MPDPCDLAQDTIEQSEKIREQQRQARLSRPVNVSEFCVDCDEFISSARQLAVGGTDRCTQCQDFHNKRNGLR